MKFLWRLFLTYSRGKQIAISVVLAHGLLLLSLMGHHFAVKKKPIHHRIAVHTVSAPRPTPPVATSAKPKKTKVPEPVKKIVPTGKPKTAPPKKQPILEEPNLLEELTKNLETFSASVDVKPRTHKELSIPSNMPIQAQVESHFLSEPTKGEVLIAFLQSALQLPEIGEVVAKISISPSGDLVSCDILEARSKKNSEFLKNRLPELRFPCFNDGITFTITFRNVEI